MTPGMKTNNMLITITKPEEQVILPEAERSRIPQSFLRGFSSVTAGNR
jgi:hypothetical protein